MEKAINCDETCSNFADCDADGVTSMFLPGATCGDRPEKEQE